MQQPSPGLGSTVRRVTKRAVRAQLVVVLLSSGCAATLPLIRVRPPALSAAKSLAVAASGPYATELIAGLRHRVGARATVEACVLGCPTADVYLSVTLTPGPHEGRVPRTCQAEVYRGKSWVQPEERLADLVRTVDDLEGCVELVARSLLDASKDPVRVPIDERGPLREPGRALREGRFDDARGLLEVLLQTSPTAGAWYDLGLVHEAAGRLDEARRCYASARALSPDEWLQRALEGAPAADPQLRAPVK